MSAIATTKNTITLAELAAKAAESAKLNEDREGYKASDLEFSYGHLVTPDGKLPMTEKAARQLAVRAGVKPACFDYLLEQYREKRAKGVVYPEFNTVIAKAWDEFKTEESRKGKTMLVRCRRTAAEAGGQLKVRAVLTDRYGIFDTKEFLERLLEVLPEELHDAKFSGFKKHLRLDEEGLRAKLILPKAFLGGRDGGDPHDVGLVIGNNECGNGGVFEQMVIDRLFCTNQLVSGKGYTFRFNHSGNAAERVMKELAGAMREAVARAPQEFQTYWNTRDLRLEDPAAALRALAPFVDLGKRAVERVVNEKLAGYVAEHGPTAFAVVNSLTEFARDMEDAEKAWQVEVSAGRIAALSARQWAPHLEVSAARN